MALRHRLALPLVVLVLCLPIRALPRAAFPENPPPSGKAFYEEGNEVLKLSVPLEKGLTRFEARVKAVRDTRESLGIVLSGGSARAFAHVGVLKALEEKDIRPDFIVADSMGGIVALLYAAGLSPDSILRLLESVPAASLFDPIIPTEGGFLDTGRFKALVRAVLGEVDIKDLPVPLIVVCEDLVTRRQVLLSEGELATVMIAAFALPAIFEPVRLDDLVLIDGGITSVVPAAVAAPYADRLIAATSLYDPDLNFNNPFVVLNRSIDIGKTRKSLEEMAVHKPLVIRCAVEDLSYMEFSDPLVIAERGYRSAQAVMEEVLAFAEPRKPDPAEASRRAELDRRLSAAISARRRGDRFPMEPDFQLKPAARLWDEAQGGAEVWQERRWLGLKAGFVGRRAELGLSVLAGLEGDPGRALGLGLALDWAPLGNLKLSGQGLLSGPASADGAWADSLELSAALALQMPFRLAEGAQAGPILRAEGSGKPADYETAVWGLSGGAFFRLGRPSGIPAALETGWLLDSSGSTGPFWDAGLALRALPRLELRLGSRGRWEASGSGFRAEASDGYRGVLPRDAAELLAFGSLEAAFLADFLETDVGEMFMIERPELAFFLDALHGPEGGFDRLHLGAGLALGGSISLLGLAPLSVQVSLGRDLAEEEWSFSIRGGRRFPD